jgi:hypothetical protein
MYPVKLPPGYVLGEGQTMQDVLRINAELLASEGPDPEWPGFDQEPEGEEPSSD